MAAGIYHVLFGGAQIFRIDEGNLSGQEQIFMSFGERMRAALGNLALVAPMLATILAIALQMLVLSHLDWFIPAGGGGGACTQALLQGCRSWYVALAVTAAGGFLLVLAVGLHLIIAVVRNENAPVRQSVLMVLILLAATGAVGGGMLVLEDVPGLYRQAGADIAAIQSGRLEEETVWISPKTREAAVPGPWSSSRDDGLTRIGVINQDIGKWLDLYVPDGLDFALDREHPFNENWSYQWNQENARQYQVFYTPYFHFVVTIRPLAEPAGSAEAP